MKIGLLGQFGSGNSGNDGSLEAMLVFLRRACPDAALLCICSNPAAIRDRFSLEVSGLRGGGAFTRPFLRWFDAALLHFPGRLAALVSILRVAGGINVMIIPGTGILDDFQETPFGWPFIVFWWCLAARLHGARIAFTSIGAGPIRGTLSRWFLKSAVRMADYRSYRDDFSLRYVQGLGIDTSSDHRFPDLAFGLREPTHPQNDNGPRPVTIGIGVMRYRGWERNHANAEAIYRTYVNKIAVLANRLLDAGHDVRLFMGDTSDTQAINDVREILTLPTGARKGHLSGTYTVSLQEVMEEVLKADIAIVSRYHNLLCTLKIGRPALSLGYAEKNDELMAEFGRAMFCQHIETFDVEQVLRQVHIALGDLPAARSTIAQRNATIRAELVRQQDLLLSGILLDRSGTTLPLAQDTLR